MHDRHYKMRTPSVLVVHRESPPAHPYCSFLGLPPSLKQNHLNMWEFSFFAAIKIHHLMLGRAMRWGKPRRRTKAGSLLSCAVCRNCVGQVWAVSFVGPFLSASKWGQFIPEPCVPEVRGLSGMQLQTRLGISATLTTEG